MTVTRRRSPPASTFLPDLGRSYYWDSYEAPLRRADLAMHESTSRSSPITRAGSGSS